MNVCCFQQGFLERIDVLLFVLFSVGITGQDRCPVSVVAFNKD